jgi:hypothetical protein
MSFKMDRVHVWAAKIKDEPGGVAQKLAALAEAGANLDYIYTERSTEVPGTGLMFVAPINGPTVFAAKASGFMEVHQPIVMRIEGDNTAGLAFRLKREWARAGLNLHGSILTVVANKFVGYLTFDSVADANRAAQILAQEGVTNGRAMQTA